MNNEKQAFAKYTPSVFVLESPFQLLCAIEAIHEFEIADAKFVFSIVRNSVRNKQLFEMAKRYGVEYDIYYEQEYELDYFDAKDKKLLKHREDGHYKRIFIGDVYNKYYYLLALHYAEENAIYVGMDDGNSSINFLQNKDRESKPTNWRKRLNWYRNNYKHQREQVLRLLKEEHVYDSGCMFTVYSEIRSRYSIYPNTLSYIKESTQKSGEKENVVLVVGIVFDGYSGYVGVSESLMESVVWQKLSEIRAKYPSKRVVYIPHGRDTNVNIAKICSILGVEFCKIDEVIETFVLNSNMYPEEIYGFDSSALVNLKILYPETQIHSWRLRWQKQESNTRTKRYAEYYTKIGIIEDTVWVHKKNFINRSTFIDNIRSMFWLIYDKIFGTKHN